MVQNSNTENLLLSTGLCFRSHSLRFGGEGYPELYEKILSQELGSKISQNLIQLLKWKTEEVKVAEATPKWACDWCSKKNEESVNKYEKGDYVYCSMECIRAHKNNNF